MKKVIFLYALLVCISCKDEPKNSVSTEFPKTTKEKIVKRNDEVVISIKNDSVEFFTNLFINEFQDKPDMLFLGGKKHRSSVTIPTKKDIRIVGGDPFLAMHYNLKIEKGDSLRVDVKKIRVSASKEIEYPVFEIPNSTKTWHELNFEYLLYKKNVFNKGFVNDPSKKFVTFSFDLEKMIQNSSDLLDSLKTVNKISDDFYSTKKQSQKIKHATYAINNALHKKRDIKIDSLGFGLNDSNLFDEKEYISFLRATIRYKYFKKQRRTKNSVLFDFVLKNDTFLKNDTKEILLDAYLKSIFFIEKHTFKSHLEKFNQFNTNTTLKEKWEKVVQDMNANAKKVNQKNRTISTLTNLVDSNELTFEEILSNQKGKVVLVDFWASWCSPCRQEMPPLKKLKDKFKDANFQVIEISIDKDYNAWERASKMEEIHTDAHSYIISNWTKSNLYKNYNIKTIPRYLLFDKTGKIISKDAPRPSDKALEELIQAHL